MRTLASNRFRCKDGYNSASMISLKRLRSSMRSPILRNRFTTEIGMSAEEVAQHIYKAVLNRKRDLVLTTKGRLAIFLNKWLPGLTDKLVYNELAKEPDSPLK